jgi:Effector Associated Constant Component 1
LDTRISVAAADFAAELESLCDWLRAEPELDGRVHLTGPVPAESELGALADAIVVAVGTGGVISVLASSLKGWLSQPRRADVRIRVHGEDGLVLEIDADRIDSRRIESILRQAMPHHDQG